MNLTEASRKVDAIVDELLVSTAKEQVEKVFSKNNIDDKTECIQLLRKCMGVIGISNTTTELSIDDEYSDELEIFLNGTWRFLA
jgi:hypothetical protein